MTFRVLVVDDSNFFQHRLKEIINEHPELKVVGIASNGREAVEKAKELRPDIITMDFEMPVMDGVTAIKLIMAERKVPILMFSSLTYEGARITLDALAAGALDYIAKDFAEVSRNSVGLKQKLHERLITLARVGQNLVNKPIAIEPPEKKITTTAYSPISNARSYSTTPAITLTTPNVQNASGSGQVHNIMPNVAMAKPSSSNTAPDHYRLKKQPKIIVIGASTGGPVALTDVLIQLPKNFPQPIVLVQHMPENFTKAFAERLNKQCNIRVREAVDGDILEPGLALLAPGGKQLMLDKRNGGCVRIFADDDRVTYKPSLDITFGSAANSFGDKVLGIVLTGMGADGCKGARLLKEAGSELWSQDEASSVIYGMPMAVARAGLTDRVLSLSDIGSRLAREVI
ncbi:MAG: chemotaxis response regulator protein-glutamate methylesterase [Pseudomonadota bacterium]